MAFKLGLCHNKMNSVLDNTMVPYVFKFEIETANNNRIILISFKVELRF